jgi:VWFA-related protein
MWKRLALASVLAAVALSLPQTRLAGRSQQKPQQPVFRSDAHFVLVDAYPIRDGKVVEGLTAADFEVREEGVLQTIETFEFIAGGAAEPESARRDPNTVAESRAAVADPRARAFVVDLDIDHVSIAGSHRIRVPLVQMLNQMLGPQDLFGVISTEHDPGSIAFARKVTTTEDMLARYWSWGMRGTMLIDPEEQGIIDCFGMELTSSGVWVKRYVDDGARRRWLPDVIIERHREAKVLDHLNDLVDVLGHLREGRTSVVLVTEGWRLAPEDRKLLAEIDRTQFISPPAPAAVGGRLQMFGSVTEGGRGSCTLMAQMMVRHDGGQRLRDLIARANQRNISFIPVNPSGLVVTDSPPSEDVQPVDPVSMPVMADDLDRVTRREDGLRTLANNTDGTAVLGNNDLRAGLRKVTAELRSFYLLGYYSTNRVFDGKPRRITVKAKDYDVRARRGYIVPTEAERTARANPVKAAGPSAVELALDVLSGLRSADDRTFNVSRYLKADAAPVLGIPAVFRATPSPRSPLVPVTAPAYTRNERIHIEWPVAQALTERMARVLGRNSAPLAVAVTLTEREGPTGPLLVADAALGALAPGDYVVELRVTAAGANRTSLVAFRVVP